MRSCLAGLVLLLSVAPPAAAQHRPARFWLEVNGGWISAIEHWDTSTRTDPLFGEDATRRVVYPPLSSGGELQVGVGYRFRPRFGVSVQLSRPGSTTFTAGLGVKIPSPTYFNAFATDNDLTSSLSHSVRRVDVAVSYELWAAGLWQVRIFGGPSVVTMSRDQVTTINYVQTFTATAPVNVVDITGYAFEKHSTTSAGFNAGIDVSWMPRGRVGLGGVIRASAARLALDDPLSGSTITTTAGGLSIGGGLRVRF